MYMKAPHEDQGPEAVMKRWIKVSKDIAKVYSWFNNLPARSVCFNNKLLDTRDIDEREIFYVEIQWYFL